MERRSAFQCSLTKICCIILFTLTSFSYSSIFFNSLIYAQSSFHGLDLVGEWNIDYGEFYTIKFREIESTSTGKGTDGNYALCATSKGMVILKREDLSVISFVPVGNCEDVDMDSNGKRAYAYLARGEEGLSIFNMDNPEKPYFTAQYETSGYVWAVYLDPNGAGDYLYVADGDNGIHILDIRDKSRPMGVGNCDTPGNAHGITISGKYAYVADGMCGLQIIDINNKNKPEIVGTCDTPGFANRVTISGNYAYVADGRDGIQIIDISDRRKPERKGNCDTPDYAYDIAIPDCSDDYAYVADGNDGLQIIDIHTKNAPMAIGSCYVNNTFVLGVTISGDFAYVASGEPIGGPGSGIYKIDMRTKNGPFIAGSCLTPGYALKVAISGNYAYVVSPDTGLHIFDINDPKTAVIVGSCNTPGSIAGASVAVSGDYAFVANREEGLQIINIRNKNRPAIAGSLDTPGTALEVAVSGDYAYVADGEAGLQIIDISKKDRPLRTGSYDTPGMAWDVAVSEAGDYAYVADGKKGLEVLDISNKYNPQIIKTYPSKGDAYSVTVSGDYVFVTDTYFNMNIQYGSLLIINVSDKKLPTKRYNVSGTPVEVVISENYAYVAAMEGGLHIIDFSNMSLSSPVVTNFDTPGLAQGVAIKTDYAFVADQKDGLQVIDITIKSAPEKVGNLETPGYALSVAVDPNYAYVANGMSGLQIIDINDKNNPKRLGNCDIMPGANPGIAEKVAIFGDYAFIAGKEIGKESGLQVIDIKNKKLPQIIGTCLTPRGASGVAIDPNSSGDYAYVANDENGLQVINVSKQYLTCPFIEASCDTPGKAVGVAVSGNYAYIADYDCGLQIIDISDPNSPRRVGTCDTPDMAVGVAISGDYAYVADFNSGLQIINIQDSTSPEIVGSSLCGIAENVAISYPYAFVTDNDSALTIIDISTREAPVIVGMFDTPGAPMGISIQGNYAYVADGQSGLQIIDITYKNGPMITGSSGLFKEPYMAVDNVTYWYSPLDPVIDATSYGVSDIMYVSAEFPSRSEYARITIIGAYSSYLRGVSKVVISGNYAYAVDNFGCLRVIDLNGNNGVESVGVCPIPGRPNDVAVSGDYAYVVDTEGLWILDINKSYHTIQKFYNTPVIEKSYNTPGTALGVDIAGDYAFVADGDNGLQIINVHSKNAPQPEGNYDTPGYACGVDIAGDYAFVADGDRGLQIINVHNKNSPQPEGNCDTPGYASRVTISDHYAFVADQDQGLQIIDIHNTTSPVGTYNTPGHASEIAVQGNYAFVADGEKGLQVIDIEDKTKPFLVENWDTPGHALGVTIYGDHLFLADGSNGLLDFKIKLGYTSIGNLILVAGGGAYGENTLWPATELQANRVFNTFTNCKYEVCDIYYFNPVSYQDVDNDRIYNQFTVDDATPTKQEFFDDAFVWAMNAPNTGPLYICLTGHGAKDRFQVMPNQILTASELKENINTFQSKVTRPVALFLEFGASGSFIDDMSTIPGDPDAGDIVIITSTGEGPSYIKPSPDPDTTIPISFTNLLMDRLQGTFDFENYPIYLKEAFINARKQLYTYGYPFLDQAPQMYISGGPINLTFFSSDPNITEDLNINGDPNIPSASLTIRQQGLIPLVIKAEYPDGTKIIDPSSLVFLSSNRLVFDPGDPNQREIVGNQVLIHPHKLQNGLTTLIAYPDPQVYPDILLTARLPIEVDIPGHLAAGGNKAIVVAGYRQGDSGAPDPLWAGTNTIANQAYRTLRKKGYGHEDIYYLNPYALQDADYNNQNDDIDGHPDTANLEHAFQEIAKTGFQELLIFLVDHGNKELFDLNPCCSRGLSAEDLAKEINDLTAQNQRTPQDHPPTQDQTLPQDQAQESTKINEQAKEQSRIITLIDACHSGSFQEPMQRVLQESTDPNRVILITSTQENQLAYFEAEGLNSFSFSFFNEFSLTNSLQNAFDSACRSLPSRDQTPCLNNQAQVKERDQRLVFYVDEPKPVITKRDFSRKGGGLEIQAEVYSLAGIDRVWVIITSCGEDPSAQEEGPRMDAPQYELTALDPNAPYGGNYYIKLKDPYPDAFNYQILLSAKDKTDQLTTDRATVSSLERNKIGAVIVVTDPVGLEGVNTNKLDAQSREAYNALKKRGVLDDNIYYVKSQWRNSDYVNALDNEDTLSYYNTLDYDLTEKPNDTPSLEAVQKRIPEWLQGKDYRLLLIYLVGQGAAGQESSIQGLAGPGLPGQELNVQELTGQGGASNQKSGPYFYLNQNEPLYPADIVDSINAAQYSDLNTGCQVLLLYDAPFAQEFMQGVPLQNGWVGIARPAVEAGPSGGADPFLFFSTFFRSIQTGDSLGEAYEHAYYSLPSEYPCTTYLYTPDFIADNCDTIKRELGYHLGSPASGGSSFPYPIQDVQAKEEGRTITVALTLKGSVNIPPAKALLFAPGKSSPYFSLFRETDVLWDGNFSLPAEDAGLYQEVSVEVKIPDGSLVQATVSIIKSRSNVKADQYEPDDSLSRAERIFIDEFQYRSFHSAADVDWVYFYGFAKDGRYTIKARDTSGCTLFVRFCLFDSDGRAMLSDSNIPVCSSPKDTSLSWPCTRDGYYYLQIEQASDPNEAPFQYTLSVQRQTALTSGGVVGRIVDEQGNGVNGVGVCLVPLSGPPTQPKISGSIKEIPGNVLPSNMNDGWFFFSQYPSGRYQIKIIDKDDHNTIIMQDSTYKWVYSLIMNYLGDITIPDIQSIHSRPNSAVKDFESVYNYADLKGYRPLWADKDNDGFSNLEEFLSGKNPNVPDPKDPASVLKCLLHEGLNLFPYSSSSPNGLSAYGFCSGVLELEQGDSFGQFNHSLDNPAWSVVSKTQAGIYEGDIDSLLVNGRGYLIYYNNYNDRSKALPKVILQDRASPQLDLNPGLNLISIPAPEGKENYTAYQFLKNQNKDQNSGSGGSPDLGRIQSISRYNPENGTWESSSWFFGQPTGVDFPILPYEAYLVMYK